MMKRMDIKIPMEDIINPVIALPLPPASFFATPAIEKIRPGMAGSTLTTGIQDTQRVMIPSTRPTVAATFTLVLVLLMGVIITGC